MEITRTTLGIAVGVVGTLFLGYCVYFDKQRRKDPLFKKKLREREYFNYSTIYYYINCHYSILKLSYVYYK